MSSSGILSSSIKTAVRRLLRDRGVVGVNVFGLSLALAAVVLLGLFIQHERGYDAFHDDAERMYRLGEVKETPSGTDVSSRTRMPAMPTLVEEVPEVRVGTRFLQFNRLWMEGTASAQQVAPHYVDSTFTEVFDFEVLHGDLRTTLARPNHLALTAPLAVTLFGSADVVGRTVDTDFGDAQYEVGAVMAEPPSNSTVTFEALTGWITQKENLERFGGWYNTGTTAYVRLQDGVTPQDLDPKLDAFSERHFAEHRDGRATQTLRPLLEEHARTTNSSMLLKLLAGIALAVLLVATINFTNLTTARGLDRMSEVGMRRALGAGRKELIGQFLAESVLMALLALLLAGALVLATLPAFNGLLDVSLSLDPGHVPAMTLLAVLVGLAVGVYPALHLTRATTADSLRGQFRHSASGQWVRRILVVGQFAVSVALIAGALGVWLQIDHLKSQDPGFDQEHVFALPITTAPFDSTAAAIGPLTGMQRQIERLPGVIATSFTGTVPTRYDRNYNTYTPEGASGESISLRQETVGDRYFETLGIEIAEGQTFRPREYTSGSAMIQNGGIINQAAADRLRAMTGRDAVVGLTLRPGGSDTAVPIVGVTRAFQNDSAVRATQPTIHYYGGRGFQWYEYLAIRVAPGSTGEVLDGLQAEWSAVYSTVPFDPVFLDDALDALYETQEQIGTLAGLAAGLAVIIACLGIFGLAAFQIRQRLKEITVRKVLGASTRSIVQLLTKDVARLALISFGIAIPAAYVGLQRWLDDFATRIDPGVGLFGGACLLLLGLAVATVGVQALRAARTDPAPVLQRE